MLQKLLHDSCRSRTVNAWKEKEKKDEKRKKFWPRRTQHDFGVAGCGFSGSRDLSPTPHPHCVRAGPALKAAVLHSGAGGTHLAILEAMNRREQRFFV